MTCEVATTKEQTRANHKRLARAARLTHYLITNIDRRINATLNNILHHPDFQRLEAAWLNLLSLSHETNDSIVRVLNVSWQEIQKDLSLSLDIEHSYLFELIHNQEFDMPGGVPYGLITIDHAVNLHQQDLETLRSLAQIASHAFAPMVLNLNPHSLGLNSFHELDEAKVLDHFQHNPQYNAWLQFRKTEEAKFINLCAPSYLLRKPYKDHHIRFPFNETTTSHSDYLWGGVNYLFVKNIMNCFNNTSWFNHISDEEDRVCRRGTVKHCINTFYSNDEKGYQAKSMTDSTITERQMHILRKMGIIALCQTHRDQYATFYHSQSIQNRVNQSNQIQLDIAAQLQYLLSACRFAHYIKIIGRRKIGSYSTAPDIEFLLNQWLMHYVANNEELAEESHHRYPLKDAKVKVVQARGFSGRYLCTINLLPRLHLQSLHSSITLITTLHNIQR